MQAMFLFISNITKMKAPCNPLKRMNGYHRSGKRAKAATNPNIHVRPMMTNNLRYRYNRVWSFLLNIERNRMVKISGFHGGDNEEWCLLGCYAVWLM
jgi:hypothetical protein